MYGIISVAILTGIIGIQIIKEITSKTSKENLEIPIKKRIRFAILADCFGLVGH
jgi:hypothetical protein